jgi:probable HAF family extracellular repeat protein
VGFLGSRQATWAGEIAFTLSPGGVLSKIDQPGVPVDINDSGQIAGYYTPPGGYQQGYVDTNGTITGIDFSSPLLLTVPTAINNAGQVVGFLDSSNPLVGPGGFLYTNGVFTTINPPNARATFPTGINNLGQILGTYFLSFDGPAHVFLYTNGFFTPVDFPGGISPQVVGIDDAGRIVGNYGGNGFVYANGVFTSIKFLGAYNTVVNGISASGEVIGTYTEASPEPRSLLLLASGLAAIGMLIRWRRTPSGPLV